MLSAARIFAFTGKPPFDPSLMKRRMTSMIAKCYFITFTTYGTHLLGDARGSTRWDGTHINPCEPLRRYMSENLSEAPFFLSSPQRAFTHDAIHDAARTRRYFVDALNVRMNHIHIVACALDGQPVEEIVSALKYVGGSAIRRALPPNERSRPIWTRSFSSYEIHRINVWRAFVQYSLIKQGCNCYLRQTYFAKRTRIIFNNSGDALNASLYDAYQVDSNAAIRNALFHQYAADSFQEEIKIAKKLLQSSDDTSGEDNDE